MMVRYKMKRLFYNLGFTVEKEKWNKDSQRCKRSTTHGPDKVPAARINAEIQHYEDETIRLADSYRNEPSVEEFKMDLDKALDRKREEDHKEDFFAVFDAFIEEEGKKAEWTKPMRTKMATIRNHINAFDRSMSFDKINLDWMEKLCLYYTSLNFRSSYVKKLIETTKIFLKWAYGRGYFSDESFKSYRCRVKEVKKRVIFLTKDELMKVYHFNFGDRDAMARLRDCFCFSCFTSLRYSDVKKLKKADIVDGVIHVTTQKTSDTLSIELNDYSAAILERYKDIDGEYALPVISNVKMNEGLKEMGRIVGLDEPITETYYEGGKRKEVCNPKWKLLSTHCGRRTFICYALSMGIPPNVVMKWTGHSDYKSMQPYIDVADEIKRKAMNLFNQK